MAGLLLLMYTKDLKSILSDGHLLVIVNTQSEKQSIHEGICVIMMLEFIGIAECIYKGNICSIVTRIAADYLRYCLE